MLVTEKNLIFNKYYLVFVSKKNCIVCHIFVKNTLLVLLKPQSSFSNCIFLIASFSFCLTNMMLFLILFSLKNIKQKIIFVTKVVNT